MRRWFAILLLALLPLQSSWAAVASYCGHEADSQAQHLGHHEHQHAGAAADADRGRDAAGAEAPTGFDFDCLHCLGGCAVMPLPMDTLAPFMTASQSFAPVERVMRTLAQAPPERPQWARLA